MHGTNESTQHRARARQSTISGYLPRNNPLLGMFTHAPTSGAASVYTSHRMVSRAQHKRDLALRRNPYTGAMKGTGVVRSSLTAKAAAAAARAAKSGMSGGEPDPAQDRGAKRKAALGRLAMLMNKNAPPMSLFSPSPVPLTSFHNDLDAEEASPAPSPPPPPPVQVARSVSATQPRVKSKILLRAGSKRMRLAERAVARAAARAKAKAEAEAAAAARAASGADVGHGLAPPPPQVGIHRAVSAPSKARAGRLVPHAQIAKAAAKIKLLTGSTAPAAWLGSSPPHGSPPHDGGGAGGSAGAGEGGGEGNGAYANGYSRRPRHRLGMMGHRFSRGPAVDSDTDGDQADGDSTGGGAAASPSAGERSMDASPTGTQSPVGSPLPSPRSNFTPIGVAPAHLHIEDWYDVDDRVSLGEGAFGKICSATRKASAPTAGDLAAAEAKQDQAVVVKIVRKAYLFSDEERESVCREAHIHATLNHPHIVKLYDAFESESRVFLVMEKVEGQTLHDYMRNKPSFTEVETAVLLKQLVQAVAYLHAHGIIHCDIKPQNILLQAEAPGKGHTMGRYHTVKLCDFGTARRSRHARYFKKTDSVSLVPFSTVTGTMGFVAPEVLRRKHYDAAIDMWSIGVLLYEMLVGFSPFYPYSTCIDEDVQFPDRYWRKISKSAKELTAGLLRRDAKKRCSAKAALEHAFWDQAGT